MKKPRVELGELLTLCSSDSKERIKPSGYSDGKRLDNSGSGTSRKQALTTSVNVQPVRPPKWECEPISVSESSNVELIKANQVIYLRKFRTRASLKRWNEIRQDHFDWWQFPIDSGSREEYNLRSESDIALLRSDVFWLAGYRESIRLVAFSFGWNVEDRALCESESVRWEDIDLTNKDVRLYKMVRSTWLFGIEDYFSSLQAFARYVDSKIYGGTGFHYGSIHLSDMLSMQLPRQIPITQLSRIGDN